MVKRICGVCKIEKSLDDFPRNRWKKLGHDHCCKVCRRELDRKRNLRPDRRRYIKEWERSERGKANRHASRKADRTQNKEKYHARLLIRKAIKEGRLVRLPCEKCGDANGHGHHPDYSQPLKVIWLCPKHHAEAHRK